VSLLEFSCQLRYPSGFACDLTFRTEERVTAILGPSGSGKTSLLSMLAGLRKPASGRIRFGDRILFESAAGINLPPEKRRIGYVFQDQLLFPHLSVRRNLLYGWKRRPANGRTIDLDRVVRVLELTDLLDRQPNTLSGGQKQRVALGRALLSGPELLLLDEPLASVDDTLRQRVLGYIESALHEWQLPTLYVTHNAEEAKRLAGWVVMLAAGRVCSTGEPDTLMARDGTK
jgi:molybdate transport system ATP-binding protein